MAAVTINALDAGNPLFLQNNDHSNVPLIGFKLTGTENYKMWSTAMKIALTGKNNSLSPDLYLGQVYSQIASEVWDELQETYDKMDGSVIFNVINKIHGLKQGDLSVPEYYHKLNSLWREFDTLTLLPACTCAAHEGNIRSNILAIDPLPDVKEAFNVVSREESHRGLHPETGSGSGNKVQPAAFVVKSNNFRENEPRKSSNNSTNRGPNLNLLCKKYGLIGHMIERCMRPTFFNGNVLFNMHFEKFLCAQTCSYMYNLTLGWIIDSDCNCSFGFDETKCYIHDLNLVKTLGTGCKADGLYLFDVDQIGKSVVGCANFAFVCHVSKQLWRSRLGHPADHVLSVLKTLFTLTYGGLTGWSDNGIEFVNNKLDMFFKEKGIIRQKFYARTPQQIGISERKLRYLLNVARGLMFQGGIPLNMWPECILTIVYLINSLPSSVLSGASPYFEYESELNLLNFFDNSNDPAPKVPNDDEREHSTGDGNVMASHDVNSSHHVDENATFATPLNENNSSSEGQQSDPIPPRFNSEYLSSTNFGDEPQTVRRSDRVINFPNKYNDYILPSNKKYGIKKRVNYSKLSGNNMCFASNLNKSCELKSFKEVILDKN
ncbi:ribonuclease H-like domain-containing protein [Tanacetum coccineum]